MATADLHTHQDEVLARQKLQTMADWATVAALVCAAAVVGWYVYTRLREKGTRHSFPTPPAPGGETPPAPPADDQDPEVD